MKEQWRTIPTFETYEASNLGRIRNIKTGTILKPNRNCKGYRHVVLYRGSKKDKHMVGVHRAVALAWIDNPNNYDTVNHKDANPDNNCVDNLEWMSNEDNVRYTQGIKVMCVETGEVFDSINEAYRIMGIAPKTIKQSISNEYQSKKRSKYTWKYVRKKE